MAANSGTLFCPKGVDDWVQVKFRQVYNTLATKSSGAGYEENPRSDSHPPTFGLHYARYLVFWGWLRGEPSQ
jgi:hypothetical protein